jgi:hypothetical protein
LVEQFPDGIVFPRFVVIEWLAVHGAVVYADENPEHK